MSRIHVEAERVIAAPAADVYAFLADYTNQRPKILPPENYLNYRVEQGGKGAGTVVAYTFSAARRQRPYRLRVDEPAKGTVLTERDLNSSLVNTWTVTVQDGNGQSRVRLATEWEGSGGVGGFFERTFAPGGLRRVYDDVLARLANAMSGVSSAQ